MKNIKNVLFVCTGNSCRSIMAEAYFKKRVEEENFQFKVKSAGTLGITGMLPTPEANKVIADEGIDAAGYRSTGLTEDLIKWADVILIMEPAHKAQIYALAPGAGSKVHFLGAFNKDEHQSTITDPIGKPLLYYRATFDVIKRAIEELIKWIEK